MIHLYFLSLIYLLLAASLHFVGSWSFALSFFLALRERITKDQVLKFSLFAAGLLLCALELVFPVSPGPRVLGDLVVALALLYSAVFYFRLKDSRSHDENEKTMGIALLVVAALHFLFPFLVLL